MMKVLRHFSVADKWLGCVMAMEGVAAKYLEGGQNGVCLADNSNDYRTLLDGFLCILDLEDAALRRAVDGQLVLVVLGGTGDLTM